MNFEMLTLWTAVVCYVVAGSVAIVSVVLGKRPERVILGLIVTGLVFQTLSLGLRWQLLGHGPYTTFFEILSSNVWSLMLVFALAYWRIPKLRPTAAVVMPVFFLLMGWMILLDKSAGPLPATYHTVWLFIHIGFSKVFLGMVLVALGLSGIILMRHFGLMLARWARLPENARLEELAFRFMAIGFIFETLMLISGAIWAQDAWGRYWAWDPLETWAFITWLVLAFWLHARFTFKMTPVFGAAMVVTVFVLAFLTFFGVPLISAVPHQGAV